MSAADMVARVLARSWDPATAPAVASSPDLEAAVALLLQTGGAALGWRRLANTPIAATAAGQSLRDAFRLHAIEAAVIELHLKRAVELLGAGGFDPILCKGWSVARAYPETGLRPYGDVDMFLPPPERARALACVAPLDGAVTVDLDDHDLGDLSLSDLYGRSRIVSLDGVAVRILSAEHQLRSLCVHQLRHGLWRPLWLVDIAVLLESLDGSFDWDLCFSGPRQVRDGVECVVGLARDLLGARMTFVPAAVASRRLPRWLVPAVLEQWPKLTAHYYDGTPLAERLREPRQLVAAIRQRWPSKIEATVSRGAPFNDWPRWPIQLADCAVRLVRSVERAILSKRKS